MKNTIKKVALKAMNMPVYGVELIAYWGALTTAVVTAGFTMIGDAAEKVRNKIDGQISKLDDTVKEGA